VQPLLLKRFTMVNSLGAGVGATLGALQAKRSGLVPCNFESAALETYVGPVRALEDVRPHADLAPFDCRLTRIAQHALQQDDFIDAVSAARERYGAKRIGVFMGTSTSGILETELAYRQRDAASAALPGDYRYAQTQNSYSLGDFVRRFLDLKGPSLVVSSACSSTSKVFGNAARMIAAGVCDAAIVGGADTLCLTTLYGFRSLELTSRQPCRPFDAERDGISIGEGAGFALVEKPAAGRLAGATLLLGIGESSDAYHMSTPHPEGAGAKLAMSRALASAGVNAADIGYINLHGTATRTNDAAEDKAVYELFGARTPCSSTKGATGHLLGAAGITGVLVSALAMRHGVLPGSANTRNVDPALKSRYLLASEEARVRRVLANSFGFGGSNCSLVLGTGD
jgi:3-oxoacyl-[acyl-carrier-protein] synthase I